MTLQLKERKTVEETTDIELPAFFKNDAENAYIGIFDIDDAVKFSTGTYYHTVQRFTADFVSSLYGYQPIDEQEFRIEHYKQMQKFNLPRREITTSQF